MNNITLVTEPTPLSGLMAGQGGWVRRREVFFATASEPSIICLLLPDEVIWPAQVSPLPDNLELVQESGVDQLRGQVERTAFVFHDGGALQVRYPGDKNLTAAGTYLPSEPRVAAFGDFVDIDILPGSLAAAQAHA